ncbi:hypothetical protein [Vulcaniibacterium tengchongense]|uniref:Uncharacterized protein n=1 Tax=Vulcaniibacterium tengchongense TaxID=1273429 RepID=A0A3N4W6V9_9GAMM|nr:hypothetical protein [Vulcaniibacterium tengchongense]RPE81820.1 hypothetical protein EDC50_1022 [Vulcaniibacterium tengchongense]
MKVNPIQPHAVRPDGLRSTAAVIERLEREGIRVLSVFDNGRRPVLIVNSKPSFADGVRYRRHPVADGHDYVCAAPYEDVQVEWVEHAARAEVANG